MTSLAERFLRDESGATAIEYSLVAVVISVGIIGAASSVRDQVVTLFEAIASAFTSL